ncbi:BZ3500_MvSof-1268-A1-R1_Chr1-1g01111 [Microbotryum saponariae]|uniref:BZ3500_MvSof-1268-A1-R1_Chr1-1g01111 protein n=1 Tax=Microbotryum saponariae TaxID=289078 RepID=A0A2X0KPL6_9BASI|nr:BZ3500_MvSof-1268-A1-R1_Chr1-1g01111 [Microbotryum saponariae]SCZ93396.1 BZ3501_MvSof-1269-A2-R1_Chr1-1g00708 [Microbotryum saponariae]
MVPGTASLKSMREVQRQRSLGLHAQARYRHGTSSSLGHPTPSSSSSGSDGVHGPPAASTSRRSVHGGLHHGNKSSNEYSVRGNARTQAALQEELLIAHGHVPTGSSMMSSASAPSRGGTNTEVDAGSSDEDQAAATRRRTSLRLDQLMVHKPPRLDLTHDYEVITPHARVITLPDDTSSPSTSALSFGNHHTGRPSSFLHPPRQGSDTGSSSASEEDDDWELLGMDEVAVGPTVAPQVRTWASIVSRV